MKRLWNLSPLSFVIFFLALLFSAVSFFYDWRLAVIELGMTAGFIIAAVFRLKKVQRDFYHYLSKLSEELDPLNRSALEEFPMPVLVSDAAGRIQWFNQLFSTQVVCGGEVRSDSLSQFTSGISLHELTQSISTSIEFNGRMYTVYTGRAVKDEVSLYILYFIDDTSLKKIGQEYADSRPSVMLITIDSLDELVKNVRESEQAAMVGGVEQILENWMGNTNGFLKKLGRGRFLAVVEERHLRTFLSNRFSVLDTVRSYSYAGISGATLSIGVGRGDTMAECEELARQALDMALGRGGDQVAVKSKNSYEFFGGVSKGVEKRTKVRTRIIASAITELIEGCDNVLIMGHRFADLDAFGASVGIWRCVKALGKPAHIVMSRSKSLAIPLLERIEEQGVTDMVIEPEDALIEANRKTLLIVCDTHKADFTESPELLEMCKTIVVIDHHRKTVDHIDNAVIFFHEPYASSASEMVAELTQYMSDKPMIGKMEAEALLAGIMLDTRDFVMRTGVRTFEAAAYLRSRGADTVEVKQLFANSMESYLLRTAIIANTKTYHSCAIAVTEVQSPDIRVVSSQAADELLNIRGIKASFVLFRTGRRVNISARSMGDLNVQVVMEKIGGGGHQTMAAAQLDDISMDDAVRMLAEAIKASNVALPASNQE